jgi:hypothetical protein
MQEKVGEREKEKAESPVRILKNHLVHYDKFTSF